LEEAIPVEAIILGIPDQTNSARSWRKANGYGFVDEQVLELVEA
jgi:threonine aldolase